MRAKLGLHEAIKCLPEHEPAKKVLNARMMAIQLEQDDRGLCAESRSFWQLTDDPGQWNTTHKESTRTRKKRIRRAVDRIIRKRWEEWCKTSAAENGHYDLLCPPLGQPAEHLQWGSKTEIGLMITMRCGGAIMKGNKTTSGDRVCDLPDCKYRGVEDENHVMLTCGCYETERARMMADLRNSWNDNQSAAFDSASDLHKRLLLLGKRFEGGENEERERKRRDAIVKTFLVEVNELRKGKYGRVDLCSKAEQVLECSLAEALQWEEEAKAAYEDGQDSESEDSDN